MTEGRAMRETGEAWTKVVVAVMAAMVVVMMQRAGYLSVECESHQ